MKPQLPRRKQKVASQRGGIISKGIFLIFLVIVMG